MIGRERERVYVGPITEREREKEGELKEDRQAETKETNTHERVGREGQSK